MRERRPIFALLCRPYDRATYAYACPIANPNRNGIADPNTSAYTCLFSNASADSLANSLANACPLSGHPSRGDTRPVGVR